VSTPSVEWLCGQFADAAAGLPPAEAIAAIELLVRDLLDATEQTDALESALIQALGGNPETPTAALHAEVAALRRKLKHVTGVARDLEAIARRLDNEASGRQRNQIDITAAALVTP
jgi:hypothetical protein